MCTVHQRKAELRFLKRGIGSQRYSNCNILVTSQDSYDGERRDFRASYLFTERLKVLLTGCKKNLHS